MVKAMSTNNGTQPLRFHKNGTFRVLQLADTQQGPKVSLDTIRLIEALLDRTQPDLVVYTGDQLKGNARGFRKNTRWEVAETIHKITVPVVQRGIPFTVTFGNHDEQVNLSYAEQRELYAALPGCLMPENGPDPGTFQLVVQSANGAREAMALYLVDSGGGHLGRYEPVMPNQLSWLRGTQLATNEKNGAVVPGMVFQHIPVPEIYELLQKIPCWRPEAVYGLRRRQGCFILNKRLCRPWGRLSEPPSVPVENSGEFALLMGTPGIFALFCGHDHRNTFSGWLGHVELGYTPSCGFDSYGAGTERGGRLFVFHEADPAAFETRVYTYRQLVGRRPVRPVRNAIDTVIPANMEDAARSVMALAGGVLAVAGVVRLVKRARK